MPAKATRAAAHHSSRSSSNKATAKTGEPRKPATSRAKSAKATSRRAGKPAPAAPTGTPPAKRSTSSSASAVDPGMSDAAVQRATGKSWSAWFTILDKAGAAEMKHPEIVRVLTERHGVDHWWAQSVTVGYERVRGLREKGQTAGGFQISASKTVAADVGRLFAAFDDPRLRRKWLTEPITVRKATPDKSLRITWADGTHVDVYLTSKGSEKSQVSIQHSKLPDQAAGERLKQLWSRRLADLKQTLEA